MSDNLGEVLAAMTRRIELLERAPKGFAGRTSFSLEAANGSELAGSATVTGTAARTGHQSSIALDTRHSANPTRHGRLELSPDGLTAQIDDALLTFDPVDGLFTNRPARFQRDVQVGPGADLVLGSSSRITNGALWEDIAYETGFGELSGWRKVQVKHTPDGAVRLRGITTVPAGFGGGVIGLLPETYEPTVGEVFTVAAGSNPGVQAFIHPDRRIEIITPVELTDGYVSFGSLKWDRD